ncbi:tRNA methyltransferase, has a role in tRNA modification [Puccinia graminis f. sp. tritici]|uniref:tRNA methyltransferase, has a role in tRNA modification n=1 Tax=Puccinia graminis f. sp. tritici TaxID=56615 RepID=A0A5B0M0I2_PUCGR|nr:tRNA methyltransferase, has a role in tRNA modification [Puccinia graminis f. sp. tritici]
MRSDDQARRDSTGAAYEQQHVHQVYESIAVHFSQTRYKPWPIVADFLDRQPRGSIGLDVGSGNGKYLHGHNITNKIKNGTSEPSQQIALGGIPPGQLLEEEPRYFLLGLDRSASLLSLSQHIHSVPELVHGDCLSLPFRSNLAFDFAISIATLHHLSTQERRLEAVKLLLSSVKPSRPSSTGRILIFVWAHEQGQKSRRKWAKGTLLPAPELGSSPSTSSIEPDLEKFEELSNLQDVLVPWVLNNNSDQKSTEKLTTYNRYYHLFREGELIELVKCAAESLELSFTQLHSNLPQSTPPPQKDWCLIKRHGWEADNWWVEVELGIQVP